jgi:hypothetical protein
MSLFVQTFKNEKSSMIRKLLIAFSYVVVGLLALSHFSPLAFGSSIHPLQLRIAEIPKRTSGNLTFRMERLEYKNEFIENQGIKNNDDTKTDTNKLSAAEWIILLTLTSSLLGLLIAAVWIIMFSSSVRGLPLINPNVPLFFIGIIMMILGPILGIIRPYQNFILPVAMNVIFAGGWLLAATAMRIRASYAKGSVLSCIAYIIIGLEWVIYLNFFVEINGFERLSNESFLYIIGLFFTSLFWPLQLALWFGLFGLGLN